MDVRRRKALVRLRICPNLRTIPTPPPVLICLTGEMYGLQGVLSLLAYLNIPYRKYRTITTTTTHTGSVGL